VGFIYRPLLFASVNPLVAQAKGVPVQSLSIIFMALLGLAVTMAIQVVGTLLLFALLVTPAATAIRLAARPLIAMFVSTTISVVSVWVGLGLSAMFNMPPSFVIVAIACMVWFVVQLASHRIRLPVRTSHNGRPPH
jgi:zinc/manganese transport system permease protein